jgi:Sec-independent protein translocase protein TatA
MLGSIGLTELLIIGLILTILMAPMVAVGIWLFMKDRKKE